MPAKKKIVLATQARGSGVNTRRDKADLGGPSSHRQQEKALSWGAKRSPWPQDQTGKRISKSPDPKNDRQHASADTRGEKRVAIGKKCDCRASRTGNNLSTHQRKKGSIARSERGQKERRRQSNETECDRHEPASNPMSAGGTIKDRTRLSPLARLVAARTLPARTSG